MLLKALFFAVLVYFVFKAAVRLLAAMKTERTSSRIDREPAARREGNSYRRSYDEEDVEDAKFVDVK